MSNSPLIWAGGKSRAINYILPHLPDADCLIEPFVGSATIFMKTDYRRYILCDKNYALITFYSTLTRHTEAVIKAARVLFKGGNDKEVYALYRAEFNSSLLRRNHSVEHYAIKQAALFLYLNRHCFSGMYRENKSGMFNTPFGYRVKPFFPESELRQFVEKAKDTRTKFFWGDFRATIPCVTRMETAPAIYCDPPYLPASETANFTEYTADTFGTDEHRDLAELLYKMYVRYGAQSVISGSDTPETRGIYSDFNLTSFSVRRTISKGSRDMAGEVVGRVRSPLSFLGVDPAREGDWSVCYPPLNTRFTENAQAEQQGAREDE